MPIEVYPIICQYNNIRGSQTPDQVAESIQTTYEKVIQRGGSIIAEHVMPGGEMPVNASTRGFYPPVLYLVAEIPE